MIAQSLVRALRRTILAGAAACAGCFAESAVLSAGESDESSGTDPSGEASSDGWGGSGTSTTTEAQSGSGSGSTEDPTTSTEDTASAGSSSGGSSTDDGEGTSSSDGGSSSSGGEPDPFGDCYDDRGAMLCPGVSCILDVGAGLSACSPSCAGGCGDGQCVGPIADQQVPDICILPCSTDADCDGVCGDTGWTSGGAPILACMWP